MQFRRLRPRRGLSTSRSTMPLINNNSAHIRGDSQAQWWGNPADRGTTEEKEEGEFRASRRGVSGRGFSLSLSLCALASLRDPRLGRKPSSGKLTLSGFSSDTSPPIHARDAHPLRGVATVIAAASAARNVSSCRSDTITPRSITIDLHDRARALNGRASELQA